MEKKEQKVKVDIKKKKHKKIIESTSHNSEKKKRTPSRLSLSSTNEEMPEPFTRLPKLCST